MFTRLKSRIRTSIKNTIMDLVTWAAEPEPFHGTLPEQAPCSIPNPFMRPPNWSPIRNPPTMSDPDGCFPHQENSTLGEDYSGDMMIPRARTRWPGLGEFLSDRFEDLYVGIFR